MRVRGSWSVGVLVLLMAVVAVLFATGRLQFHWRPESRAAADAHSHDGEKEKQGEEESRISGDKAIFDNEALKAAALKSAPAEKGSVGVLLQVTGEVQVPDDRVAHITPRVNGVVREVHKARGEPVAAGASLAVIESTDLGEAKAAYVAALSDLRVAEANIAAWQRHQQGTAAAGDSSGAGGWLELDQAVAEQASARTDQMLAARSLERLRELHERGLRSRTELLAAEADEQRAAARVESSRRRLAVLGALAQAEMNRVRQRRDAALSKLRAFSVDGAEIASLESNPADITSRFVIRSPIAGMVAERHLTVGETIESTTKIFSIADLSEVWVKAALFDKDLGAVRTGMRATIAVQGLPEATFQGQVKQLAPQVDEKTRTLPVRIAVKNRPLPGTGEGYALRPGMFATVDLETSRRAGAVVVPTSALQTVAGQSVVFVETALSEGAAFQRRPVVVGARDSKVVEIVEGLQAGERVVIANAYLLKSEFERSKISHGHAH